MLFGFSFAPSESAGDRPDAARGERVLQHGMRHQPRHPTVTVGERMDPEKSMVGDNYLNARMEHRIHLKSRILYHRDEDFWLEWEKENDSFVNDLNLKHIVKNCVMIAEEPELYAKRFDNHYQPLETFWEWRRGPQENLQTLPMVQPTYTIIFKGSTLGAFANKEAVYEMTDEERLEVL